MEPVDVAIVGGGPAGLAAALSLADADVSAIVIDEQPTIGGQIYRQPPPQLRMSGAGSRPGAHLIDRAEGHPLLRRRLSTCAWAILSAESSAVDDRSVPLSVAVSGPDGAEAIPARRVLLASGAYDLPVAFPGWTLPGVMSAGGVQAMIKSQRLLPGRRFVLAGAHPLLVILAGQLLAAGGEVAEVALAQPAPAVADVLSAPLRLGRLGRRMTQLAEPAARLLKARVPISFSTAIVGAAGDGNVTGARLARVEDDWSRVRGSERELECDTIALGYGFLPSTELARQAGCAVKWQDEAGGWVLVHDEWMRASRREIFVVGELTGIAGAQQAEVEGRLAAVGILRDLERLDERAAAQAARHVRRQLARERRFSRLVQERFAVRRGALAALADESTVICRCEEVSAGELRAALSEHPHLGEVNAVKLLTRIGMGRCQGRMCGAQLACELARARGISIADAGLFTAQPPVKPVRLADLARVADL
ncbi:MAG: FAD/NAD(P)-dependent oxidoreductase [Solirubrobacteraceae bacterium]